MITLNDLTIQYRNLKEEIDRAISDVLIHANFIGGATVKEFEDKYSNYIGVKHCVSCGNGTDALEILLQAYDIGIGDEVLVPAISWIATSEAVSNVGAIPVFVDVDMKYFTIDVDSIEQHITDRTKAIIPVHLYGQACDMDRVHKLASDYGLIVIEDCAQAHGALWDGKKVGGLGHASAFSFYPGKILGAYGDAGCILSNDEQIAEKVRMISNHGQLKKHHHIIEGRNSRMDSLQAAILLIKIKYLDEWVQRRRDIATFYNQAIRQSEINKPDERPKSQHAYHLYVLRLKKRNELKAYLYKQGIQSAIHYPRALPFLNCYSSRNFLPGDFPNASLLQDEVLSIPIYPEMTEEMIEKVTNSINRFE